ncbi:hypothetical protein QE152_g22103 [Popillia japonica]|uniref:Uncharacterized protein n=1 Tax=Popillia japonica TaxID=7064 RepID=A0AAW1KN07_POPJA
MIFGGPPISNELKSCVAIQIESVRGDFRRNSNISNELKSCVAIQIESVRGDFRRNSNVESFYRCSYLFVLVQACVTLRTIRSSEALVLGKTYQACVTLRTIRSSEALVLGKTYAVIYIGPMRGPEIFDVGL